MTIKDLIKILLPKIKIIVIFPVVFVIAATAFVSLTRSPNYSATSQVMLLRVGEFISPDSIDKAEKLMEAYVKLASNPEVGEMTRESMNEIFKNEDGTPRNDFYNISLSSNKDEYTLYVTASAPNPAVASNAANLYATNVKEYLHMTMQSDDATIIVSAKPPLSPQGNNMSIVALFSGALGLVIGVVVILAMNSMDETIKTPEDLASCLDIMVLAEVPKIEREKKNKIRIRQKKYADGRVSESGNKNK